LDSFERWWTWKKKRICSSFRKKILDIAREGNERKKKRENRERRELQRKRKKAGRWKEQRGKMSSKEWEQTKGLVEIRETHWGIHAMAHVFLLISFFFFLFLLLFFFSNGLQAYPHTFFFRQRGTYPNFRCRVELMRSSFPDLSETGNQERMRSTFSFRTI